MCVLNEGYVKNLVVLMTQLTVSEIYWHCLVSVRYTQQIRVDEIYTYSSHKLILCDYTHTHIHTHKHVYTHTHLSVGAIYSHISVWVRSIHTS